MSGYIGSKSSVTQVDGYNRTEADAEFVQDPNGAITVSGSNVGIGTSSPDALLAVDGQTVIGDGVVGSANLTNLTSGTPPQLIAGWSVPAITWSPSTSTEAVFTRDGNMQIDILSGENNFSNINFSDPDDEDVGQISYDHSTDAMRFRTSTTERMRIDSAGRVTMPYQPVISGQIGTAMTNPTAPQNLAFNEFWSSVGITYNSTTRRFTVPVAGKYRITLNPFFNNGVANGRVVVGVNMDTPNQANHYGQAYRASANYETGCINSVVTLAANDYIVFRLHQGALYNQATDRFNQFSIQLIS